MVWVCKQQEAGDPGWFSQDGVDVLVVLEGQLHVEFAHPDFPPALLQPGDLLILPAQTACRAWRGHARRSKPPFFGGRSPARGPLASGNTPAPEDVWGVEETTGILASKRNGDQSRQQSEREGRARGICLLKTAGWCGRDNEGEKQRVLRSSDGRNEENMPEPKCLAPPQPLTRAAFTSLVERSQQDLYGLFVRAGWAVRAGP